jgi:hypothetical protein
MSIFGKNGNGNNKSHTPKKQVIVVKQEYRGGGFGRPLAPTGSPLIPKSETYAALRFKEYEGK